MSNDKPTPLEQRARRLFQESSRQLGPDTGARLRQARMQAVDAQPRPLARRMLVPAGALVAAALGLVVWNMPPGAVPGASGQPHLNSEATPDSTDADLYHDLDFYRWLASQPEQPQARN